MEKDKEKFISLKNPAFVFLALAITVQIIFLGRKIYLYSQGHDFVPDLTNNNVNVMLTRPENWHKITSGELELKSCDFDMIDGSTATIPITAELARQFCDAGDDEIAGYIDHNTTGTAYESLITGKKCGKKDCRKELIFVTEPSEEELQMAEKNGISLDVKPVAYDGFVFITRKDNPVDSLTVEQVKGIYSGEITNWKEVGGKDSEIMAFQREPNSGSQTAMEQLVMKDAQLMDAPEYMYKDGMAELIEQVAAYNNEEGSIGYTFYYYINNLYLNDDIKVLKINGITPDNENLLNGTYPFKSAYYAVMREGQNGLPKDIRDYLLSDNGQELISLAGYCPLR